MSGAVNSANNNGNSNGGGGGRGGDEEDDVPEQLKGLDADLIERIENEIMDQSG